MKTSKLEKRIEVLERNLKHQHKMIETLRSLLTTQFKMITYHGKVLENHNILISKIGVRL